MDYNEELEFFRLIISAPVAKDVKSWRVGEDNSFRKVHERFQQKYMDESQWYVNTALSKMSDSFPTPHGKQSTGAFICELSMVALNEDGFNDGWY